MRPKLQNIGEKWFILSFDLRVFIEKGTILIKKRHCLTAMYQFALLAKKSHRYKAMSSLGCPDGLEPRTFRTTINN